MKLTALVASLAVVVLLATPTTSHEFDGTEPEAPLNHTCSGTLDWAAEPGVSSTALTLLDQTAVVYVHPPPHGSPDTQDPGPFLGVVWLEFNGLRGLQKNDFVCTPTDAEGDPSPHPDLVVL